MMGFSRSQIKKLVAPLPAQNVRTRKDDDMVFAYLEGWYVIKEANRIFGFDGWDRETLLAEQLQVTRQNDLWAASYQARVRISVVTKHGKTTRDGIGVGHGTHCEQARARDMALKAAETDATKRALSTFGNRFGLALYDPALAGVDGVIADTHIANEWVLVDHTGTPLGRYSLPSGFCGAYRKSLVHATDSVALMRLWIVNYSELRRLVHEVPTLKNRSGMHYGEILQRTYLQKLEALLEKRSDATALPQKQADREEALSLPGHAIEASRDDTALELPNGAEESSVKTRKRIASTALEQDATSQDKSVADKRAAKRNQEVPSGRIDKSELTIGAPPRRRDKNHLRHVAGLSCLVCGRKPSQAHHITYAQRRGLGQKVSDEFTVPLCTIHHRQLHDHGNEKTWWATHAIEPLVIAAQLWAHDRTCDISPGHGVEAGQDDAKPLKAGVQQT